MMLSPLWLVSDTIPIAAAYVAIGQKRFDPFDWIALAYLVAIGAFLVIDTRIDFPPSPNETATEIGCY